MSFSISESSEKSEKNQKRIKNYYSAKKEREKENKAYKTLNNDLNEDESNPINKKNEDDLDDSNNIRSITKIYKYITKALETFIEKNYNQAIFVNNALRTIYSHIKVYLSSLKKENKNEQKNGTIDTIDSNQKILYEIKINDLNQQLNDLKYEMELLSTNETNKLDDSLPKKFKIYNYLKKKYLKLENKSKLDEFKYLLCIKDQQDKINELENKLKLALLENSKEVKESKCFPTITKISKIGKNPKSIPLTESILKNSKSAKRNLVKQIDNKYNCFFTITNSVKKTPFNLLTEKDKEKEAKLKKVRFKNDLYKSIKFKEKNDSKDKTLDKKSEADIYFNTLKLNSQIIPNKDKNFFISHPNLSAAGYTQRINKYKINIPNKLFSFKFGKNIGKKIGKNTHFQFPSTLNEILFELEKLRIFANNTDM